MRYESGDKIRPGARRYLKRAKIRVERKNLRRRRAATGSMSSSFSITIS